MTEVQHMGNFPFTWWVFQGWHTEKTRLKSLSPWNQWDFCHWLQGSQDFLLRYFEKDCSQSCSVALTSVSPLAADDLHQLRIWCSVLQRGQIHPAISLHCYSPAWACAADKGRALIPSTLNPIPFTTARFTFCFVSLIRVYRRTKLINFLLLRLQEHRII